MNYEVYGNHHQGAALTWLVGIGFGVPHGPEIAPGEMFAEQDDPNGCPDVLEVAALAALRRLNRKVPTEALGMPLELMCNDAFAGQRNRQVHRMLVDGPVRRGAGRCLPERTWG